MAYTEDDIQILPALEALRRRPTMYIGAEEPGVSLRARLVHTALGSVADDVPRPSAVRLIAWRHGIMTIAYDGERLPIAPSTDAREQLPHPALYHFFLHLSHTDRSLNFAGTILSAFSEHLAVSTVHDGRRYYAGFSRGGIVTLLREDECKEPLGTNWFTFAPDTAIITGDLSKAEAAAIAEQVTTDVVPVRFIDRTAEGAPQWR